MRNKLKVLAVGDPAVYAYRDPKYSIIENFNQENDVEVEFTIVPWDEYYPTMMQTFAGEYDYDIVMVAGHLWLVDFVQKGYVAEVSIPNPDAYDEKDILEVIREEMKIGEKIYLYPSFCDGHILLYRKSILKELLGELLPEAVDTDALLALASLCDGKDGMRGIALKAAHSEIFTDFLPYLRNEGIDAFDQESHTPTFNNEQGKRALEKYLSLKEFAPENTFVYGNDEVREAFQKKETALAVTWGGQLGVVLNQDCQEIEDVGFSAIKTSWNVTWSFAINAKSKHQSLANQFLAYLTSKEVDRIVGGYAGSPVRKSTYVIDGERYPWYKTHLQLILKYAKPLPSMEYAGDKTEPMYQALHEAFVGKIRVAEALEEAENRILHIDRRRS